ncbi:MAG: carboxylesterase/lipase family protein [Bacteroidales bacterium]|nr:carboxylesterase/lipase family protein [Bacteroidales bacterium]
MKPIFKTLLAISAIAMLLTGCISNAEYLMMLGRDYGANKEITDGNYDKSMAVKCQNGVFVGVKTQEVGAWKGIPFAKAPIGERRFKAPEAPDASDCVYEAYNYAKMPIAFSAPNDSDSYSEDCLYLNVFTAQNDIKNKPVMVWIHGGGYILGSASGELIGELFAKTHPDLVVASIEYRLHFLGFNNFEDIPGGEAFAGSQNNAIKDQIMALKWINQNIAQFGGDPNNVTIFGESAGSFSTCVLTVIDEAKGLFNKAIMESGVPGAIFPKETTKPAAAALLQTFGAKDMNDILNVSTQDIIDHMLDITAACHTYGPAVEEGFLSPDLMEDFKNGKSNGITIMQGYNAEECRYFIDRCKQGDEAGTEKAFEPWMTSRFEKLLAEIGDNEEDLTIVNNFIADRMNEGMSKTFAIEALMTEITFGTGHRQLADILSTHGNTYFYYFAYPSNGPLKRAAHGAEEYFVFNGPIEKEFRVGDYEGLYKHVGEVWESFAKTGVPTIDGVPVASYDVEKQNVIVFDKDGKTFTQENYLTKYHNTLKPLFKYELSTTYNNFTVSNEELSYFGM